MDKENYIVINGKKTELTEEQLKALGIEIEKKTVFDRVEKGEVYYYIDSCGNTIIDFDDTHFFDGARYDIANYCTDKALMEQRALHEALDRLLWRFSMEHDGDKIEWNASFRWVYHIGYDHQTKRFRIGMTQAYQNLATYFYTRDIAERAIKEIIKPFMAEHLEFRW